MCAHARPSFAGLTGSKKLETRMMRFWTVCASMSGPGVQDLVQHVHSHRQGIHEVALACMWLRAQVSKKMVCRSFGPWCSWHCFVTLSPERVDGVPVFRVLVQLALFCDAVS